MSCGTKSLKLVNRPEIRFSESRCMTRGDLTRYYSSKMDYKSKNSILVTGTFPKHTKNCDPKNKYFDMIQICPSLVGLDPVPLSKLGTDLLASLGKCRKSYLSQKCRFLLRGDVLYLRLLLFLLPPLLLTLLLAAPAESQFGS